MGARISLNRLGVCGAAAILLAALLVLSSPGRSTASLYGERGCHGGFKSGSPASSGLTIFAEAKARCPGNVNRLLVSLKVFKLVDGDRKLVAKEKTIVHDVLRARVEVFTTCREGARYAVAARVKGGGETERETERVRCVD